MKVVYIGMILLVCIIQSLIRSSHGSICSTINCGDKEQCYEYNSRVAFCLCLPNLSRNYDTDECESKYEWIKFTSQMINNNKLVGFEKKSDGLHVLGRFQYNHTDIIPGDVMIPYDKLSSIRIINYDPYTKYTDFKVLQINFGHTEWHESSKGKIESHTIEAGYKGNETIYVCRIPWGNAYRTGWMRPSKQSCFVEGDVFSPRKYAYELLIHIS